MLFREPPQFPIAVAHPFDPDETSHFISLGAGVQSTVLYLMAARGMITPMPYAAIFADTQWEPTHVYQHLAWLESLHLPIPIHRITAGNLFENTWLGRRVAGKGHTAFTDVPTVVIDESGNPGMRQRQCTTNYKVTPIIRHIRRTLGRKTSTRGHNPPFAVQWIGITPDEWMRAKDSRNPWVHNAHPLIDAAMSRHDCVEWFRHHYPNQPLAKSSCVGCPYHSNRDWLRLYRDDPQRMQQAVELDRRLREPDRIAAETNGKPQYLHPSGKPLQEVLDYLDEQDRLQLKLFDDDANLFAQECDGHCGV